MVHSTTVSGKAACGAQQAIMRAQAALSDSLRQPQLVVAVLDDVLSSALAQLASIGLV